MNRRWLPYLGWGLLALIGLGSALAVLLIVTNQNPQLAPIQVAGSILWSLLPLGFGCVAALIIYHQPNNLIGWLLAIIPLALTLENSLEAYLAKLTYQLPQPSIFFTLLIWFSGWSWLLLIFPILLLILYFPTGRLPSPRWRWVATSIVGLFFLTLAVITFSSEWGLADGGILIPNPILAWPDMVINILTSFALISLPLVILICIASIFIRFRNNGPVERQQIKWLLSAGCLFGVFYLPVFIFNINQDQWTFPGFSYLIFPFIFFAFPAAIAIAILRYRLWDIDIIIRKTLVYGALTALLALVYFGSVVLLQQLFGALTGQEGSPLAVVISTLTIAALFNPLRRRLQDFIDRRFYRQRYDAERTLVDFANRARSETDLGALSDQLTRTAAETLQPIFTTLWLADPENSKLEYFHEHALRNNP